MAEYRLLTTATGREAIATNIEKLTRKPRLLIGPAGTGKTSLVHALGKALGMPVYKLPCSEDMTRSDVIGGNQADPWSEQPLRWTPGPALVAMGYGLVDPKTGVRPPPGILLIDDMHLAIGSAGMSALYEVLDCGPGGQIMLPTGEVIQAPGPDLCRVVCTANGMPSDFPEPIQSRLGGSVRVSEPSKAMLAKLVLCSVCLGAQPCLEHAGTPPRGVVARLCMADYAQKGGPSLTYRHWLNIAELWGSVGLAMALMTACDGDHDAVVGLLQPMAAGGVVEAGQLLAEISKEAPSGAPGGK
jgi:hypothetical protein